MKQTTKTELIAVTERLNNAVKESGYFIKIGHRNNYTAIDLHGLSDGGMKDYLIAGITDKQAINYMYAMLKGIGLISNPLINK
jgi:hypothetical protein